jgi:hypothetical protein
MSDKNTKFEHNVNGDHHGNNYTAHTQNFHYETKPSKSPSNVENSEDEDTLSGKIISTLVISLVLLIIIVYMSILAFVFWVPLICFIILCIPATWQKVIFAYRKSSAITGFIILSSSSCSIYYWWHHGYFFTSLITDIIMGFLGTIAIIAFVGVLYRVFCRIKKRIRHGKSVD